MDSDQYEELCRKFIAEQTGITVASNEDTATAVAAMEKLQPGDDLRLTIPHDDKVQELRMKFPGP